MTPSLLAPAFLAGLVAMAIPILVHLVHRQRAQTVAFPSLMFLHKVPFRSVRRQRLRHLFLLLLRCLALGVIALAFARPFFPGASRAATRSGGARERVILLDRSYSMGYGTRWERARAEAGKALDDLTSQDKATLVLFAETAEVPHAPGADLAQIRAVLDAARVWPRVTRYGPALKLAQERLAASSLPRREAVLITDFQKSGWAGQEDPRLPEGTDLRLVDVGGDDAANVAVTAVGFQREYQSSRERVLATARVANRGPGPREAAVALELGGRVLEERRVGLPPSGAQTVTFSSFPLPAGTSRGRVRTAGDALPMDDVFHFVLAPGDAISVLAVEGRGARVNRSLYLARALAIGDRPRFRLELKRAGELAPADLDGRSVVVLNDAPFPPGPAGARLRALVESGGGLLVACAETGATGSWPEGLLPAGFGEPLDRARDGGATLAWLDHGHPVFELFGAPHTGDFSSARFLRYRPLQPQPGTSVLARFDDGSPALVERKAGKGRVVAWASSLDTFWNDLAIRPVFLPFVHQLVKHLAGHAEARSAFNVGEVVEVPGAGERVSESPSGERAVMPASIRYLELGEPGFYEVRAPEARGPSLTFAVNADRAESDLSRIDPEEVKAAIGPRGGPRPALPVDGSETTLERERRQALWRYLLGGALLLLAVETALANRLSTAVTSERKPA